MAAAGTGGGAAMQFTLKQVTYFLAVAEAGSMSGGAAQLGVSQRR